MLLWPHVGAGEDPFRRSPVVAVLPAVRLDNAVNFRLFSATLCEVFMGGKSLKSSAWMVFLAALDAMIGRGVGRPEVWTYFMEQVRRCWTASRSRRVFLQATASTACLWYCQACANVLSTPDFTAIGKKVPLLDAMAVFATATDEILQLRRSITTVCVIIRTLLALSPTRTFCAATLHGIGCVCVWLKGVSVGLFRPVGDCKGSTCDVAPAHVHQGCRGRSPWSDQEHTLWDRGRSKRRGQAAVGGGRCLNLCGSLPAPAPRLLTCVCESLAHTDQF